MESSRRSIRESLPSWLFVHNDRRTELYTLLCFSAGPIAGSVVSFAVNIGAVGGVLEVLRGTIPLSRDRFMIYLTVPIYLYSVSYLVALAANPQPTLHYALPVITLLLFPFLYSSWCLSKKETVARAAVNASMVACYGALALAVLQFHAYGMRSEGGAGNAIVFAAVTCLSASVALAGAFMRRGMASLALFGAYCAGSIAILYSGSRITWLALFLCTAAILWIFRERRHAWSSAAAVTSTALAVAIITFVGAQIIPERLATLLDDWQEITERQDFDSSLGRRAELWQIGLSAIEENPLLGHGPQAVKPLIIEGFKRSGLEGGYTHFHNGFLTAWIEAGLLGVLALAAIFVAAPVLAVRTLMRTATAEVVLGAVMLIAVTITYVVCGLTGIIVGHDVLDAMLVTFLIVGAYLASGTSMLPDADS